MDSLYIVVPCYNEEEVLHETTKRLTDKIDRMIAGELISQDSRIMYVDDGSKDKTWQLIEELHGQEPRVLGVKLSRNRGHQNALLAGLMTAKDLCDVTISMDADLQDDIEVLDEFVRKYQEGCDIVYGVRNNRDMDTGFKRNTAQAFYKLLKFFGVDAVYNHADYRLMSKRALEGLAEFGEVNLFLRGIVPQIGYKTATVEYSRGERFAGESKYPLKKMVSFAFDGITSFSVKPIRMITTVGLVIFLVSLIMLVYSLVVNAMGHTQAGWTSMMMSIWLLGGLQLMAIGIIGEYVGKAYMETKKRPKYIIETVLRDE
ncbi:glycosyltransferase family 2 protein [Christensenella tenuis]|jgi:polyisoprenyl-phosphate glycosyltransferase|uniref:Glycosyltransferase family 2 protein n=1 Tax=Christensenella tenuis TaxID=2763033 RepID=A0ABR7EID6_9FIRM|nr:glycosyltransferase family 2 protein [Christensenella tenuis]MBC5649518.1 glycosyltransferase family 2 protein [Christensenella tenuis]